ncbi:MAG: hypothetical protein ABI681_00655 [Gemmatimonadales bacterium]
MTFTGQSLSAAAGSELLILGDSSIDYGPPPLAVEPTSAAGRSQGITLELGSGRVVVLGEAAELTAQKDDKGRSFGVQLPDNDNQQFALNILHWLSRLI